MRPPSPQRPYPVQRLSTNDTPFTRSSYKFRGKPLILFLSITATAVGRIMKAAAAPVGAPWLWTILSYENRQPEHGYKVTREAAMGAFAKSWRRE